MTTVEQLDLLAFLAELAQPTEQEALDAAVLGWMIQHDTLALIVRALDDAGARAELEQWAATTTNGCYSRTQGAKWEKRGLLVTEWPDADGWLMTWERVEAAVTAHSTPETRRRFLDAHAAEHEHQLTREDADRPGPMEQRRVVLAAWLDDGHRLHLATQTAFAAILPTDDGTDAPNQKEAP